MKKQGGMILLFCLVFLALLTLMAVSGLESILLHERVAANQRQSQNDFAAAGAALREAESALAGQCPDVGAAFGAGLPGSGGLWPQSVQSGSAWWQARGIAAAFPGGGQAPRFHVESWRDPSLPQDREPLSEPIYYRVTASGSGLGAILQITGVIVCADDAALSQARLSWRQIQ
ncbi:MAG: PilX N-terminal domain-containing pilus assembly protein [Gammaproteobacteria bacterium]|nr:PilX N-terminal domain-containing pilus assembly protein [Gammaproteobacteria bacterium]MCY4295811.1 PilX N-terminal domain-containing pilus assembly protein [Gammaproteobacteria bacterium]